ncbi:hypothetical protein SERLADRAFT_404716 [Serpula lacrymans var. lacrymans S7.9]|uniref:DDE-1 domain-containing protein n=1 Tax=Serpula lacrymans var. lacrymans (strain S7.9) TaxID=578457 RepID=F8NEJ7_SERL9|nr:uncharacterized protein SERLADRAFT_404716 [Serpula lacrymans var. lacrymans S7.9]EGO30631.1 hypothetical protein SERLADRAFT_404716 [Serpula lacrymans var. lacrymans S7.9]
MRANGLNPPNVECWFDLVEACLVLQSDGEEINPKNIYGMDETGNVPSDHGTCQLVEMKEAKRQLQQGSGDHGNVTAIITVCADGTTVQPTLIFKGKNIMKKWGNNNIANGFLAKAASGSFLVLKALVKSFSLITKPVLKGPPDIPIPKWSLVAPTVSVSEMLHNDLQLYASELQDSLMLPKQHVQGRDAIIKGAHAQLVIQDIFTMKQGQALYAKENWKENEHTKLFHEGKGRHLTSDEFILEVEQTEQ